MPFLCVLCKQKTLLWDSLAVSVLHYITYSSTISTEHRTWPTAST